MRKINLAPSHFALIPSGWTVRGLRASRRKGHPTPAWEEAIEGVVCCIHRRAD